MPLPSGRSRPSVPSTRASPTSRALAGNRCPATTTRWSRTAPSATDTTTAGFLPDGVGLESLIGEGLKIRPGAEGGPVSYGVNARPVSVLGKCDRDSLIAG